MINQLSFIQEAEAASSGRRFWNELDRKTKRTIISSLSGVAVGGVTTAVATTILKKKLKKLASSNRRSFINWAISKGIVDGAMARDVQKMSDSEYQSFSNQIINDYISAYRWIGAHASVLTGTMAGGVSNMIN